MVASAAGLDFRVNQVVATNLDRVWYGLSVM